MRFAARRLDAVAVVVVPAVVLAGCAAPSVAPLLRVTEQALRQEQEHLAGDLDRDLLAMEGRRRALRDAYDADLRAQAMQLTIDPQWVQEATDVYVAAREALVRHEWALSGERQRRRANLDAALEAQRRALQLLERQDDLVRQITNPRILERITP